jgi:hypothetical protein
LGDVQVREDQQDIINYVKDHFVSWMEEKNIYPFPQKSAEFSPQLLERMVRVEEGIKYQNENLERMMVHMEKRFEEQKLNTDRQFAEVDRRFNDMDRRFNRQGLYQLATFAAIVSSAVAILMQS